VFGFIYIGGRDLQIDVSDGTIMNRMMEAGGQVAVETSAQNSVFVQIFVV
jgi:hypothetical protein